MTKNSTIGIIPARGGSKGIPRKNIKELHGEALIHYTIDAALNADSIDRVLVSTDDEEIAEVASNSGADIPFMRPAELAEDDTPTEPVITHALRTIDEQYEKFALLQPTSPFRTAKHIEEAVDKFERTGAVSLISVYATHTYRWKKTDNGAVQLSYGGDRLRRQDAEEQYIENGAIYLTNVHSFLEAENLMEGKTVLYEMSEQASIDIDDPFDLWLAESMLRYEEGEEGNSLFNKSL